MSRPVLDKVLSCSNLPSLPAVAVEVLELTRDPDMPLKQIARVVENDQALSAKILRTVNSSYYGLTEPCPTIGRALAYLGLSTVKTLVLSFSVVDCVKRTNTGDLDLGAFWKRVIHGASAARVLANVVKGVDPDEAFIGALLQDIGVLAMHTALGPQYDPVIIPCMDDHAALPAVERDAFNTTHQEVGAALAESWRLAGDLCVCIRHHHDADAAPKQHRDLVRVVALASLCAGALIDVTADSSLTELSTFAQQWFRLENDVVMEIFSAVHDGAKDLSRLFDLDGSDDIDISNVQAMASELLLQTQAEASREHQRLTKASRTDSLTGLENRASFDEALKTEFAIARDDGQPLALMIFDLDHFKAVNDTFGHAVGDAVLIEVARRIRRLVGGVGTACRYGGEEFAVVLPGGNESIGARLAEVLRRHIHSVPVDISTLDASIDKLHVSASCGIGVVSPEHAIDSPDSLLRAADEALYAAKDGGRNRVVVAGGDQGAERAA